MLGVVQGAEGHMLSMDRTDKVPCITKQHIAQQSCGLEYLQSKPEDRQQVPHLVPLP